MTTSYRRSVRVSLLALSGALALAPALACAQDAPLVRPGAPGQASTALSPEQAIAVAQAGYSPADVRFMQDMIHHHYQAIEMVELVRGRTNDEDLLSLASRIEASQDDEIAFMQGWLTERGETAPDPAAHVGMGHGHAMSGPRKAMSGMATPEQMAALAAAKGTEFDRQFLNLMIAHHNGAIEMTDHLLDQSGSAYDPVLFIFTTDVTTEQQAEIDAMVGVLAKLTDDPRTGLSAGYADAGKSARNMALVGELRKPAGFYDPANPSNLPPAIPAETEGEDPSYGKRGSHLSFANTDMAFRGDLMVAGNYHGFNIYRLGAEGMPALVSSVVCPGGQGDVSIVGDMLIMSVEQRSARVDCGLQGIDEDVSKDRMLGLRIFDISNPALPRQTAVVQNCRGSHTHSVVSGPGQGGTDDTIIVYVSGTGGVRDEEELAGCVAGLPGDEDSALFSIDVVEIPVADPSKARIVDSPRVFADTASGEIAGLWRGGDHGDGTQETRTTDQCHDITVFPSLNLAAGACSGNGIILDISDPLKPRRIDAVTDKGFAYWHSATFNNRGDKVVFTDEWGGGMRPRCRVFDPNDWGADAVYDIKDGRLAYRSHYKLPAAQGEKENCVAHNGSIVPVPGRDIFAQAWYQGGLSIMDFTDSANPVEIAHFDRGPVSDEHQILGGYWSTYFYKGHVYGTEIVRGIDVLTLEPSDHLTRNEIDAAALAQEVNGTFNPQQQFPVQWPADPVVALAYVDQLRRAGVEAALIDPLAASLQAMKAGSGSKAALKSAAAPLASATLDASQGWRKDALMEVIGELTA
ncbi:DUF305 domain-containing protein [Croceicoccus marinus]|jgi:uncharacterized protein (DUF305 family)|uniref:DUF305 domain-containing protein n=1 Tax=Croceicoccus marinus TaxID=450378 RepID=A0A7G6VVB0_9SPHN|nr:DUF305 domain-containing protein [Croceicoccus marinus]QNE05675.1 DUF305 domain-containing protein [Croceicoccus marinus]